MPTFSRTPRAFTGSVIILDVRAEFETIGEVKNLGETTTPKACAIPVVAHAFGVAAKQAQ
jgi:hypothetical protein